MNFLIHLPFPPGMGSLPSLLGKNIQLCRGEGNIMAVEKNITWQKRKGKQYHLPYNIEAVWKIIKRGRGRKVWGGKSRFEIMGAGKNIKQQELYTPLYYLFRITTLTTIQSKALPIIMGGKDALVKSQTGHFMPFLDSSIGAYGVFPQEKRMKGFRFYGSGRKSRKYKLY